MPVNNILLFDQNKTNMLNDSAYNTNQQRLNGVQGGIASSQLQNKFQYQVSLVAYAIASIMYNNGFDANDANAVTTFVSNMSNSLVQKVLDKASTQEAQAGVINTKWMSPSLVKAAIDFTSVKLSGSTMTGPLILSGNPTTNLQASTKQYVDSNITSTRQYVDSNIATTKQYVDSNIATVNNSIATVNNRVTAVDNRVTNIELKYVGKFNLQVAQEITILSQAEADKRTVYYFLAYFASSAVGGASVNAITTTAKNVTLFSMGAPYTLGYKMAVMMNDANNNACVSQYAYDTGTVLTRGADGKFTGRISYSSVNPGSYIIVYAL